jgi:hypothetical protein
MISQEDFNRVTQVIARKRLRVRHAKKTMAAGQLCVALRFRLTQSLDFKLDWSFIIIHSLHAIELRTLR